MGLYKELPLEKNNYPIALIPAKVSNQSHAGQPVASSVLTLAANTTVLNVMVLGGGGTGSAGVIGKWGPSSVTASNFDIQVNSGQNLTFGVPVSVFGGSPSIEGANAQSGLYNSISFLAVGAPIASVFTTEY